MAKTKQILAKKLLIKDNVGKILQYWKDGQEKKWVQSCNLRDEFVKGIKVVYIKDKGYREFIRGDEDIVYGDRPKTLFNYDSELYRVLKNMVHVGLLKNKQVEQKKGKAKSFYRLGKKYKFEPLKLWYKDMILDCLAENVFPYYNSTVFSSVIRLDDLKDIEKSELREVMNKLILSQRTVCSFFRKVALRKAGEIWKEKIDLIEMSNASKFYVWLQMVLIHYLATLEYDIKFECSRSGIIPSVSLDLVYLWNANKFKIPYKILSYSKYGIPEEYQEKHIFRFNLGFDRYMKKKGFSSSDRVKLDRKEITEIFRETLLIRAKAENMLSVVHPESFDYLTLKNSGYDGEDIEGILNAVDMSSSSLSAKEIFDRRYTSFFDNNSFFDGVFDNEFKTEPEEIRYHHIDESETEYYNKLRMLANAFEVPRV